MEDPAEVILFLRESLSNLLHKNVPVVRATARVAAMRFTQLVEEEFQSFWANPEATTAHFESRIEKLRERIRAEMLQLWAGKEVGFKEPDGVDAALIRLSNQALLRVRQVGRLRPSGTVRSATRQQEQMAPADQTIRTQTSRRAVDEMNAAGAKDVDYLSGTTPTTQNEAGETTTTPTSTRRRRGFEPDMDRHNAIAEIVSKHAPDWQTNPANWKVPEKLGLICTDLDTAAAESSLYEIPRTWKAGKPQPLEGAAVNSWTEALSLAKNRKLIVDQIDSSLKQVRKHEKRAAAPDSS
jgi:hypothetical protein